MWVSSPLTRDSLEALLVRLRGKPETRFGVFTKDEFSFRSALYASTAQARKKVRFCLVSQAARVFSRSYESGVEMREAIPAYNPKQETKAIRRLRRFKDTLSQVGQCLPNTIAVLHRVAVVWRHITQANC